MWTRPIYAIVKAALFLELATSALWVPLARCTGVISDAFVDEGMTRLVAEDLFTNSFLPSLLASAALVGLFPSWRVVRVALPIVATLTLAGWGGWMWWWYGPSGRQSDYTITMDRWPLVAAGPVGIIAATAFMFLLARARRPTAPLS